VGGLLNWWALRLSKPGLQFFRPQEATTVRLRRAFSIAAFVAVLIVSLAAPALAHVDLEASQPPENGSVEGPLTTVS
jgi:hypothetical protein